LEYLHELVTTSAFPCFSSVEKRVNSPSMWPTWWCPHDSGQVTHLIVIRYHCMEPGMIALPGYLFRMKPSVWISFTVTGLLVRAPLPKKGTAAPTSIFFFRASNSPVDSLDRSVGDFPLRRNGLSVRKTPASDLGKWPTFADSFRPFHIRSIDISHFFLSMRLIT